ncbi:MAG: hypothetical protein AABZ47_01010 [Planctomycetota bacterium]
MTGEPVPVAGFVNTESAYPIDVDISCRRCSYNLRGLTTLGRCPECGTPVGLSTQGDLLRFADPDWVKTLAKGATWIIVGFLLGLFSGCIAGGISAATKTQWPLYVVMLIVNCISLYGTWLLTSPDPSHIGEDQYGKVRKMVRSIVLVGASNNLLGLMQHLTSWPWLIEVALGVLTLLISLVAVGGEFAKLLYFERLAKRIPNEFLVKRARLLRWAYVIVLGGSVVGGSVVALVVLSKGSPSPTTGGLGSLATAMIFVVGACGLLVLIIMLLIIILINHLRKAFNEQAEIARMIWASGMSPSNSPGGIAPPAQPTS